MARRQHLDGLNPTEGLRPILSPDLDDPLYRQVTSCWDDIILSPLAPRAELCRRAIEHVWKAFLSDAIPMHSLGFHHRLDTVRDQCIYSLWAQLVRVFKLVTKSQLLAAVLERRDRELFRDTLLSNDGKVFYASRSPCYRHLFVDNDFDTVKWARLDEPSDP
jgi:hypothetical protein